jgi:diadenosine tetraphosphatase ApaH/serine/threonine PP2A family protein phosphatase
MRAVLSDIHANLEGLEAVLADIQARGVTEVYCLGDVVGYGPNPVECLRRSMEWKLVLLGNHDQAVLFDPDGFSPHAERAILWTRRLFEQNRWDAGFEFLGERPRSVPDGETLYVHGSPRNPTNEYIFPEDVYNERKMARLADLFGRYCFCGHTHVPGVFVEETPGAWAFSAPEEVNGPWRLDGRKTIVNVGSVGQPRDGDRRACYVLLDGPELTFRRVEYDVEKTVKKIYANPELADFLGDRLREGR